MLKADCGCRVELLDAGRDVVIHFCPLHKATGDLAAALRAVKARVNGVWDDPDLMAFGPLGMLGEDVTAIVNVAIEKTKGATP